jgi:hypothetical protein
MEKKLLDEFQIINNILHKNGQLVVCPIAAPALMPESTGIMKQEISLQEKRMPCNRACPHSLLYEAREEDGTLIKIHQTKCVAGWPQQVIKES